MPKLAAELGLDGGFRLVINTGDDETTITAGEFARAHAKKFLAAATVCVMFLAVSCGTNEKFFGVTGEEFMQRYNANPDAVNVHRSLNDGNAAHVVAFKIMACVAAYSIDALFTQFDRGITYSLSAGMSDFGKTLNDESIRFTAKKSNK